MNQEEYQKKAADLVDRTSECAREMIQNNDIDEKFECARDKTEETIRSHPVKTVVAGIVGGFIIGKLLN